MSHRNTSIKSSACFFTSTTPDSSHHARSLLLRPVCGPSAVGAPEELAHPVSAGSTKHKIAKRRRRRRSRCQSPTTLERPQPCRQEGPPSSIGPRQARSKRTGKEFQLRDALGALRDGNYIRIQTRSLARVQRFRTQKIGAGQECPECAQEEESKSSCDQPINRATDSPIQPKARITAAGPAQPPARRSMD
jgi:hypothetical protein